MSTRVPPFCGVSEESIVADALPRPRASRAFADSLVLRADASASSRLTSVLNESEIGPSLTAIVAFQVESSISSSRLAPGMHGITRRTSINRSQTCSGRAGTSNEFSSFTRPEQPRTPQRSRVWPSLSPGVPDSHRTRTCRRGLPTAPREPFPPRRRSPPRRPARSRSSPSPHRRRPPASPSRRRRRASPPSTCRPRA